MFSKYFELGLNPIPIRPNSKRPVLNNWNRYATTKPTETEIEEWEQNFPFDKGFGVGIVLGPSSGIVCIDIDTDDKRVLNACPISPIVRRGKKGECRFYKYDPSLKNSVVDFNRDGKNIHIDFLIERKQVVVPPSIHPETKQPYRFITPYDFSSIDDLPLLTIKMIRDFCIAIEVPQYTSLEPSSGTVALDGKWFSPDGKRCAKGSHNRLKALCAGLISEQIPIGEAIDKIIRFDNDHHLDTPMSRKPMPYFEDKSRGTDAKNDPYTNVTKFYSSMLVRINEIRTHQGLTPHTPRKDNLVSLTLLQAKSTVVPKSEYRPYPGPDRGLIKYFSQYCEIMSKGNQDAVSLGAGLALVAVICGNRFITEVRGLALAANTYFLNLAYSGFGKDGAQQLLDDLLAETGLIGNSNYRSGTALVQNLAGQQERLDVMDEGSMIFKAIGAKDNFQSEIGELLCHFFSRATGRFNGIASAKDGNNYGACHNPHIVILLSTTPSGFTGSVDSSMASKGLLPRFIPLFQSEVGEYKGQTNVERAREILSVLRTASGLLLKMNKLKASGLTINASLNPLGAKNSMGFKYEPRRLTLEPSAHRQWMSYERDCFNIQKKNPEAFQSPFYGRFAEQVGKIALCFRVGYMENEQLVDPKANVASFKGLILKDDIDLAIEFMQTSWHNMKSIYSIVGTENKIEKDHQRVLTVIERQQCMKKVAFTNGTKWLDKKTRDKIIEALVEMDKVCVFSATEPDSKKPVTYIATREYFDNLPKT